jgi:hypothetical protein
MFSKKIIDSDAFMDMPLSTQALYFHLSMRADDDGFINNPKKIQRMVGASDDDLKVLIAKRFILTFESGIIVVKHWRMHNYIRSDRYKPTDYIEEKSRLELKENGSYTEADTVGIPNGYRLDTQDRLELGQSKDSVGEDSIVDASPAPPPKTVRHKYGMYQNVLLSDEDYQKLQAEFPHDYSERIERLSEYIASTGKKYKSHLATIRAWARKDTTPKKEKSSNPFLDMLNEGE